MIHNWFIVCGSKEQGPYSTRRLKTMALNGTLAFDTFLRREDRSTAKEARKIKGLLPYLRLQAELASLPRGVPILASMDRGLRRHAEKVSCLAFSHDSRVLASGSFDKVVRLWHIPYQKSLPDGMGCLVGHDHTVSLLSFSPDDKLLASSSWDGTVMIWDMTRRLNMPKPVLTLYGHKGPVNGVTFLPDGKTLVTCGDDGTIRVWDARSGVEQQRLDATVPVIHLCSLPGGEQISACYRTPHRGYLALWDLETATMSFGQSPYYAEGPDCVHVAFAGDGQHCVVCHSTGRICMWHLKDRKFTRTPTYIWKANHEAVWSVEFSPNSKLLATASADQTAKLWDVNTQRMIAVCVGHVGAVHDVAFSPNGKVLATAGEDWIVHLWDLTVLPPQYLK